MINQLSILIPTYNEDCTSQATELQRYAASIDGLQYEILVSDDASTSLEIVQKNAQIESMDHCRLLHQSSNIGRASNRNSLVKQARYDWLL